jgi:hypothetical protein
MRFLIDGRFAIGALRLRFAIYAFCKTPHLPLRGILSRKGRGHDALCDCALRLRVAFYAFCKTPHLPLRGILSRKGRGKKRRLLRFACND